jgi:S1-C subfamily serine protease
MERFSYLKQKDAIVSITASIRIDVTIGSEKPISGDYSQTFTGFFIRDHYIVTVGHGVIFKPINITIDDTAITVDRSPVATGGSFTRFQRFLVNVYNVNDSGKDYTYMARLVGVDGAGDIAVLKIHQDDKWNRDHPHIDSRQPYLKWGDSRQYAPGNALSIIGNSLGKDALSIVTGTVRNNRFVDHTGTVVYESITTDAHINPGNSGSPMIDIFGKIIGMASYTETVDGFNAENGGGPSQNFMEHVVKAIIHGDRNHCTKIFDQFGSFYKYFKGYLGISWTVRDRPTEIPLTTKNGSHFDKRIIGINVTNVDDGLISGQESPFLNIIDVGDVITDIKIDDTSSQIGSLSHQITPTVFTWYTHSRDHVKLTYYKASEEFLVKRYVHAKLKKFPLMYDYSFGSIASLPLKDYNGNVKTLKNIISDVAIQSNILDIDLSGLQNNNVTI